MDNRSSLWRQKYKNLTEYYNKVFDPKYYEFDKYELTIDPDETVDDCNKYDAKKQQIEITKCAYSFPYFCTKYVKILHPKKGLIPFILYKYQKFVINEYENYRFNIIRKFRQGGLTTVTEVWGMWRCLFKLDQQIMFLSKTDREAIAAGEIINKSMQNLPDWLKPSPEGKWNDHHKQFHVQGGNMYFFAPEAARGRAITYLILDEAAFIPDMDKHWKAMYPTISTGGNAIVISTVNGLGNWYQETYYNARDKKNDFNRIDLEYIQHPDYHNDKWVKEQKAQLGEKGWQQEVLGSFLNSGDTYIPANIIGELQQLTNNNFPKRKLFNKWANTTDIEKCEDDWNGDGAMWLWKEPLDGHEYIFGVDCAEGVGDDGDNSSIEIFDSATLEQVAEFYSNLIPPYLFAQVVNELGVYYNNALVVVEGNGTGAAVLNNLQYECYYENLYYDNAGKSAKAIKPGIKTTMATRPIILEALQHRLMNGTVRVNSRRLVDELNTFIYNRITQKVEATKGHHDDAIMAFAIALYVRDIVMRDVPMGAEVPKDLASPLKISIYEEIKKEIMEGKPEDLLSLKNDPILLPEEDMHPGIVFNVRRRSSKLLAEFGW
jgi:hypothetical protein